MAGGVSRCVGLKLLSLACINVTTFPSVSCCDRWLIRLQCEHNMPRLAHMSTLDVRLVCRNVTRYHIILATGLIWTLMHVYPALLVLISPLSVASWLIEHEKSLTIS